mgnify:FL=1
MTGTNLVALDTAPKLTGALDANNQSINSVDKITAVDFIGNVTGLVHGIDVRNISDKLIDVDLGTFETVTNILDLILINYDFDLGSFASPSSVVIDGGFLV